MSHAQYTWSNWKLILKHCQRHNGPEGWVHITSSNTNLDQISSSESRPSINFKISTKHQPLHKTHYLTLLDFTSPCTVNVTIEDINISPIVNGVIVSLPKKKTLRNISLFETKWKIKHCQRHNGPEGWVHITRSQLTVHKAWTYCNFIISIKH